MKKSYGVNELRRMYLDFFESKGHLVMKSFSLVPHNDNSLLLINAGMAPLKPYFTGQEIPPRRRVTTCQKCVRTGDIENVGKTARHLTFFEMLGNFSFGDYFKHEAIAWSWEFLTKVLGLEEDRLYPSIYGEDEEAYEIWTKEVGVPGEKITRFYRDPETGECDNFWEHGAGPCGPCSEIYYDRGEKYFILDEADRMLDMGFADDIMQIVKYLPKERQTIMFSATMPVKIQQLAKTILRNPEEIKLAVSKPAEKIIQTAYICYENQKLGIIQSLFQDQTPERVIIFASSKIKVKEVTQAFRRMKLNVGEMHSDLEQAQRDQIMHDFKSGKINILIATDIVSRGIDIDDIRLVINYDVPHDSEDYVHRIGRTARANNDGCAITFVSEKEQTQFKSIENFIGKDIYKIPVPEELGEAPEYNPRSNNGGKRKGNFKGKRNNSTRKPGNNTNGKKQQK